MCSGKFGLLLNSDLSGGSSCGQVDTFHTIQLTQDPEFEVDHVEVSTEISTVLFTKYFQFSCHFGNSLGVNFQMGNTTLDNYCCCEQMSPDF